MIRKVIDYIKEDAFEMHIDSGYISVVNYLHIYSMEEDSVRFSYSGGNVIIKGNRLVVVKLLDNEILIKGDFTNIEFRRNHE